MQDEEIYFCSMPIHDPDFKIRDCFTPMLLVDVDAEVEVLPKEMQFELNLRWFVYCFDCQLYDVSKNSIRHFPPTDLRDFFYGMKTLIQKITNRSYSTIQTKYN